MWSLPIRTTRLFRRPTRAARKGNGTVEAVLVLPVLLAFSFGMVEFGQYFYAKHTIQAASRDGCRTAILSTATHTQATQAVANTMAASNFGSSTYTLTFTDPVSNATISDISTVAKGNGIKVTVTASYGSVGVRPLRVIPANKQLVGVTTMVKE